MYLFHSYSWGEKNKAIESIYLEKFPLESIRHSVEIEKFNGNIFMISCAPKVANDALTSSLAERIQYEFQHLWLAMWFLIQSDYLLFFWQSWAMSIFTLYLLCNIIAVIHVFYIS